MPSAVITQELHRHELKSLPGAFVELRQLPYYEILVRREKGSVAFMEATQGKRKKGQPEDNPRMYLESIQTWERHYMFKQCIANHNLENENGETLDFNDERTLRYLRPDVGMEIEKLIDELNSESDDEDFTPALSNYSDDQKQELLTSPISDIPSS